MPAANRRMRAKCLGMAGSARRRSSTRPDSRCTASIEFFKRAGDLKLRNMASATQSAVAELVCFDPACRKRYAITEVLYNCPSCGGLIEAEYPFADTDPERLKRLFRERRMSNAPLDQSGVWRYRELFPFIEDTRHVVTLREGNTPLLDAPQAAEYGG